MRVLAETIGSVWRPMLAGLLVLLALAGASGAPSNGGTGMVRSACPHVFDDADLNRTLCRINPARVWNMPVRDLLPWTSRDD